MINGTRFGNFSCVAPLLAKIFKRDSVGKVYARRRILEALDECVLYIRRCMGMEFLYLTKAKLGACARDVSLRFSVFFSLSLTSFLLFIFGSGPALKM